jgi:hypothetical protein
MLNVFGLAVVPAEPNLQIKETNKGAFFNFTLAAPDDKKNIHRYNANIFIPENEITDWKNKLVPGNVFFISGARWEMREYEEGKYPIPRLKLDRYHFHKTKEPFWME